MLRRLPAWKIAEWKAFGALEPFGDEWRQAARIAFAAAAPHVGKTSSLSEETFMPPETAEEDVEPQSDEEILAIFQAMARKCE